MKKLLYLLLLPVLSFVAVSCDDDEDNQNMLWEVVSNSDPEWIEVVNQTTTKFDSPYNIWVKSGYKEGNLVIKCINHDINFSLIGPNDSYINPEGSFSLTKVDAQTLRIHFEQDESGKAEYTDQISITNANPKNVVCNTFLFITRTFGEQQPSE